MIVVKFGGSAITDKAVPMAIRRDVISRLAGELAGLEEEIVLVHGAGYFGHTPAREHHLFAGLADNRVGWSRTQWSLLDLSAVIARALHGAGLAPAYCPASALMGEEEGHLRFHAESICGWLARGFVPILHGDALQTGPRQLRIQSGDEVAAALARALRPRKVVFGCDVDGLFSDDPKKVTGARWIDRVFRQSAEAGYVAREVGDQTGGMRAKVEQMTGLAGIPVQLLNLLVPGRLRAALDDEDVPCTWIVD